IQTMRDLNKIILIGRLGNNPVRRMTKSGIVVVHFSLATSRRLRPEPDSEERGATSGGGSRSETVWHEVVAWGKLGETCAQYLTKGRSVFVEGSVRTRRYKDKEGISRMSFEVHADS